MTTFAILAAIGVGWMFIKAYLLGREDDAEREQERRERRRDR